MAERGPYWLEGVVSGDMTDAGTGESVARANPAKTIGFAHEFTCTHDPCQCPRPLWMAYADPPYLGCCNKYDHFHGDDGLCWNDPTTHKLLIERLCDEYPDGWALSLSSTSLQTILPMCPPDVRIASWVKPFCAFKRGVRPCYGWEPVIFRGGRNPAWGWPHKPPEKGGRQTTPKDFLAESITLKKGLTGAKPEKFCAWVLDLLNVQPGDRVDDLFPGTGVMGRELAERHSPYTHGTWR